MERSHKQSNLMNGRQVKEPDSRSLKNNIESESKNQLETESSTTEPPMKKSKLDDFAQNVAEENTSDDPTDHDPLDLFSKLSLEIICKIFRRLVLKDIVKLERLSKHLQSAVGMHLRVIEKLDFCEGKFYAYMPHSITDCYLSKFIQRCPELHYIYGFHPRNISKKQGETGLSIPGVLTALSQGNLKGIEISNVFLLEAITTFLPYISILGYFRNREQGVAKTPLSKITLAANHKLDYIDLYSVTVPNLPVLNTLRHLHMQWVRFTGLNPFQNFRCHNLYSFVMRNCMGPTSALKYVPLLTALATDQRLSRMELVRVPFLGGLIQQIVEDTWQSMGYSNVCKIMIGSCKYAQDVDLGYLLIAASTSVEELIIQPSLTSDSMFTALKMADISFSCLRSIGLGFVDDWPPEGKYSADELRSQGLSDYSDETPLLTDKGMNIIGSTFPKLSKLHIFNCPHVINVMDWFRNYTPWNRLKYLYLRRCLSLKLEELSTCLALFTNLEYVYFEEMFPAPPRGCSGVGLKAQGTGLGVHSAVVTENSNPPRNSQPQAQHHHEPSAAEKISNVLQAIATSRGSDAVPGSGDSASQVIDEADDEADVEMECVSGDLAADSSQDVALVTETIPVIENVENKAINQSDVPMDINDEIAAQSTNEQTVSLPCDAPNLNKDAILDLPSNDRSRNLAVDEHSSSAASLNEQSPIEHMDDVLEEVDMSESGESSSDVLSTGTFDSPLISCQSSPNVSSLSSPVEELINEADKPGPSKAASEEEEEIDLSQLIHGKSKLHRSSSSLGISSSQLASDSAASPRVVGESDFSRSSSCPDLKVKSEAEVKAAIEDLDSAERLMNCAASLQALLRRSAVEDNIYLKSRSKDITDDLEDIVNRNSSEMTNVSNTTPVKGKGKGLAGNKKGVVKKSRPVFDPEVKQKDQSCQVVGDEIRESVRNARKNGNTSNDDADHIQGPITRSRTHDSSSHIDNDQETHSSRKESPSRTPLMKDKSTSTTEPVCEPEAEKNRVLFFHNCRNLISINLHRCGITQLEIDNCKKLQKITVSACPRIKRMYLGAHSCEDSAPSLQLVSFSQCRWLEEEQILREVTKNKGSKKGCVVYFRPLHQYVPYHLEDILLTNKYYHFALIEDSGHDQLVSTKNRSKMIDLLHLCYSTVRPKLLNNGVEDGTGKDLIPKYHFPYGKPVYYLHGALNGGGTYRCTTDMAWFEPCNMSRNSTALSMLSRSSIYVWDFTPIINGALDIPYRFFRDIAVDMRLAGYRGYNGTVFCYVNTCDVGGIATDDMYVN